MSLAFLRVIRYLQSLRRTQRLQILDCPARFAERSQLQRRSGVLVDSREIRRRAALQQLLNGHEVVVHCGVVECGSPFVVRGVDVVSAFEHEVHGRGAQAHGCVVQ